MYCDRVEAMGRMRKVLLKSRAFSYFCDIILTIRQRADYGCSALIDVFFSARTLLGNVEEDMGKLCDEVLLVLVRHFHQSILKWLCKGDDSLSEGVFRSRFSDMMMMAKETPLLTRSNIGDVVKLWRNDFGLSLPSNGLLSEEFCAKWMLEGKMRKMMKLWRTVDSNIAETMPIDAENEVESDRLLEAINSKQPDRAVQTLLSEKYAALQRMRCIQENDSATESVNEMRNPSREGSVTESIYSSLSGDGYTERIVRGLRVVVSLGDTHAMRLRYEPAFPLQIIFTQSTLSTYEELWMLMASLMFECIALDEDASWMKLMIDRCVYLHFSAFSHRIPVLISQWELVHPKCSKGNRAAVVYWE
uniref:RING-type E3 ubiquitin transferase n=1 Tax=Parascaris equorum TaxID=6256 RepID=A0A914RU44_PAREQ